jgi:hypothetical protein
MKKYLHGWRGDGVAGVQNQREGTQTRNRMCRGLFREARRNRSEKGFHGESHSKRNEHEYEELGSLALQS